MSNEEIVMRYQENQNAEERRKLLSMLYTQNERMIQKIATSFAGLGEFDDMRQEAYFGLIAAADNWTPDGGSNFISYAYFWIHQAIRRYIDNAVDNIRIPVHRKEQILKYRKYCSDFKKDHGRQPTRNEIARELSVSLQQLDEIRRSDAMATIVSLSSPVADEETGLTLEDTIQDPADLIAEVENQIQDEQLRETIWKVVDGLGEKESAIIRKRYQERKTLRECGAAFGFSLSRARELENKALRKLRSGQARQALQPFVEESAIRYGYSSSGLGAFRRTGSSSVERAVISAEEWLQKATEGRRSGDTSASGGFIG